MFSRTWKLALSSVRCATTSRRRLCSVPSVCQSKCVHLQSQNSLTKDGFPKPANLLPGKSYERYYSRLIRDSVKRKSEKFKIRASSVLVVDEDGQNLGEMNTQLAIQLAEGRNAKLVPVGKNSESTNDIPVCKIMTSKSIYEAEKKKREHEKQNRTQNASKEIQVTTLISDHDLDIKVRHMTEFLQKNISVELNIFERRLKRGSTATPLTKQEVLNKILDKLKEYGLAKGNPSLTGRRGLRIVISPLGRTAKNSLPRKSEETESDSLSKGNSTNSTTSLDNPTP